MSKGILARVLQGLFVLGLVLMLWWVRREWISLRDEIEQANHKAEVNNIRSDMTETWVRRQMQHQSIAPENFINTNPVDLMQTPPLHYLGELYQWPTNRAVWFFDKRKQCLVYLYQSGESAGYRIKAEIGMPSGFNIVRDKSCELTSK